MEVEDLSTLSIFPLCLRTDPHTSYSYISNPVLTRDKKTNKFYLKCPPEGNEKIQTFYAVIPAYVPIPPGMLVFAAENSDTDPKFTISVKQERDPNVLNLYNRVSFIAWPGVIPYTVPLFLHKLGGTVYPSFDEEPPGGLAIRTAGGPGPPADQWTQELISPIWVIPETVSIDGRKFPGHELGFECYNGSRCLLSPDGTYLLNCINRCNEAVPPENIFHYINRVYLTPKARSERYQSVRKSIGKTPNWILFILLAIFFVLILLLITGSLRVPKTSRNKIKSRLK